MTNYNGQTYAFNNEALLRYLTEDWTTYDGWNGKEFFLGFYSRQMGHWWMLNGNWTAVVNSENYLESLEHENVVKRFGKFPDAFTIFTLEEFNKYHGLDFKEIGYEDWELVKKFVDNTTKRRYLFQ